MKSRILVVEDMQQNFESLRQLLEPEGVAVVHALNGKAALYSLEQEKPDLVILDIVLSDIDGFEVCKQIRQDERTANLPVLFFSSRGDVNNRILGLESGASDFLDKGCDKRELLLRVKNLLAYKQTLDTLERLSLQDSLTRIYNRRYFQSRLRDEFMRSKRYLHNLCCLMIDVDYFKEINDTYGHPVGDAVLKKIVLIFRQNTRACDILCRYGGDEFAIILPETNSRGAYITAERLRSIVEKTDLGAPKRSFFLSLSCGISSLQEGGAFGVDELVTQADVALYQAKQAGRNKTSFYGKDITERSSDRGNDFK
ncbi:MAG: diguanylate cyclase [Candidatus Omnitrophica bacterium]|nr:diguanylate cyclase [Candidatus Omnitrophota bacterium]MBU4479377.1 diguanylate cyclase [Candidatus Omnitrophota bacterium]MCG2703241.1 diguanylate cyclase [Candidatus Omnitrophota bacterium]